MDSHDDRSKPQGPAANPDERRDSRGPEPHSDSEHETFEARSSMLVPDGDGSATTLRSGRAATTAYDPGIERPGAVIGRYKLLQELGEGGFGVVYMAEQEQPVRRRVALKIIKLGMDTKQVIARFEAERQALALMDHPNIAKVLDAGATDTGRPYFVMELVKGVPITEYCNKQNMSFRERLKLFMQVCGAVQHAHQKGIIHRDIKPSNVLVTQVDDKPAPKVIDFGIAKATQARLTEQTMFTEIGQFIGTPAYMSPEQADPMGVDIDTRSDIYSLGVLLYELLTGATPFDIKTLRKAGMDEIKRIIREEDPPRPSTRLSSLGAELDTVARQRAIEPKKLGTILRGDLDWIIMKALEKDRARRYETANGLATDIERYLIGEPVAAAPPSNAYRLQKFVRRNRGPVAAASVVAGVLILGIVGTSMGLVEANRQRMLAEKARLGESAQRSVAEARLAESEASVKFLDDMLAAVDPQASGKDVPVRAVLDQAAKSIGEKFADRPLVAARLHGTVGRTYLGLGDFGTAEIHLREALAIRKKALGAEHEDTGRSVNDLGALLVRNGKYEEAERLLKQAISDYERLFGRRHEVTVQSIDCLAGLYTLQMRPKDAAKLAQEALDSRLAAHGKDNEEAVNSMNALALLKADLEEFDESERLLESALEIQVRLRGEENPLALATRSNLATMEYSAGMVQLKSDPEGGNRRLQRARLLGEQTLASRIRVLGEEHPDTVSSMNNLASVYKELNMSDEADELQRKDIEISVRMLGENHPDTIVALGNFGNSLRNRRRFAEAIPYLERAIRAARKSLPPDSPGTAFNLGWYGSVLREMRRFSEAETALLEAYGIIGRTLGESNSAAKGMVLDTLRLYEGWNKVEPGKGYDIKAAEWKAKLDALNPTTHSATTAPEHTPATGAP